MGGGECPWTLGFEGKGEICDEKVFQGKNLGEEERG